MGSFFSCFPVSASLSRSAIQESIARTQLCTIPVVVVVILVLLFIAQLFYHLPKAILASVIVVALKGLFLQFGRLRELWKICKSDSVVWFASWLGVVLLGIDVGLGVGVITALLVVIWKSSRPPASLLGQIPNTGIYRDLQRIPSLLWEFHQSTCVLVVCRMYRHIVRTYNNLDHMVEPRVTVWEVGKSTILAVSTLWVFK